MPPSAAKVDHDQKMKIAPNFSPQLSSVARTAKSGKLSHGASIFSQSMVPKLSTSSSWWKYDYMAILFVLLPYFVSIFFSYKSPIDWPTTVSDLLLVVEVAWTVKFLMAWPSSWTNQLIQSKRNLINYVNSIELSDGAPQPEYNLNYEVIISNLQAAQQLHRSQKYGFAAEFGGVLVSSFLFKWIRCHLSANHGGVSEVNICMFLLWGTFKTCVHYAALISSESAFDSEVITTAEYVTEVNLAFVSKMLSEKNTARRDSMDAKGKRDPGDVSKMVADPHDSQVPHILKEVSVSFMPFPLSLPKKLSVCYPRASKVLALPVIHEMAEHDLFVPSALPSPTPRSSRQRSRTDNYYPDYPSAQKLPPDCAPQPYSGIPLPSSLVVSSPDEWSQDIASPGGFFKHSMAKLCEYMNDPENTKSIKLFESLHQRTHESRIKMIDSVWNLWEYATNFDTHAGILGLMYYLLFRPIAACVTIFYIMVFLVPFKLTKLAFAIILYLPRMYLRIFVLAPLYLVVKYVLERSKLKEGSREIRELHAENGIRRFIRSICIALLAILSRDRTAMQAD